MNNNTIILIKFRIPNNGNTFYKHFAKSVFDFQQTINKN